MTVAFFRTRTLKMLTLPLRLRFTLVAEECSMVTRRYGALGLLDQNHKVLISEEMVDTQRHLKN